MTPNPLIKLSTLITDDEFHAIENLKTLIAKYCPQLEVIGEAASLEQAYLLADRLKPRVVFLDIQMPGGNSLDYFDAARWGNAIVVFVTAYDEYAIQAIKVGALDYLLKPVHPDELVAAVGRIVERSRQQPFEGRLEVYVNGVYEMIAYANIVALEASGAYTRIHTDDDILISSKNIGYYEALLDDSLFLRTHKSFIVNRQKIAKVNKNERLISMVNGRALPVSVRMLPGLNVLIKR
jgi:two-component system, LytTR family, response regulator